MTAGPLGRFLELALPAPDLLAAWQALHGLGFAEATTTDARPTGYAAFSDGRVALGLHQQGLDVELIFVRTGVQQAVASLAASGPLLIEDVANVATSFPSFAALAGAIGLAVAPA